MLTFAAQTLVDGTWIITPEEPASLSLVLVAVGTLAVYGVLSSRRRQPAVTSATKTIPATRRSKSSHDRRQRRAA